MHNCINGGLEHRDVARQHRAWCGPSAPLRSDRASRYAARHPSPRRNYRNGRPPLLRRPRTAPVQLDAGGESERALRPTRICARLRSLRPGRARRDYSRPPGAAPWETPSLSPAPPARRSPALAGKRRRVEWAGRSERSGATGQNARSSIRSIASTERIFSRVLP